MSPSEILSKAADLIEPEGRHHKGGYYAATADGSPCSPIAPQAACFCAVGAIRKVNGGSFHGQCESYIIQCTGQAVATWNDAPERTQAEVVAALRKAASLAKEKEAAE